MIGGLGAAERFAIDMNAAIAARGGADSMYANDPAKLRPCNKWVDHARPIIKAMFAIEDADAPLIAAWVEADKGRKFAEPLRWQQRDYDEAKSHIETARQALFDMLDGIRDSFIADERVTCVGEPEQEEADAFNDWLDEHTITVDQAVAIVTDEHNAAYARRAA